MYTMSCVSIAYYVSRLDCYDLNTSLGEGISQEGGCKGEARGADGCEKQEGHNKGGDGCAIEKKMKQSVYFFCTFALCHRYGLCTYTRPWYVLCVDMYTMSRVLIVAI